MRGVAGKGGWKGGWKRGDVLFSLVGLRHAGWVRRVRPGDGCGGGEVEVFSLVLSV
jgi:hypothetical protein